MKIFAGSLGSKNDPIIKVVRSEFEFKTTRLEEDLNTIIVNKKPLLVRSIIETKAGYLLVIKNYSTMLVKEFESKVPYLEGIAKEMLKEFKTDKLEISVSPGNGIRIYPFDELHEDPSLSKEKDEFFNSLDKTRKIASKYGLIDKSGFRLPNYDFPLK